MKFRKLELNNVPQKGTCHAWYLIIDNPKDLFKYLEIDVEMFWNSIRSMRRDDSDGRGNIRLDHLSATREVVISHFIQSKMFSDVNSAPTPISIISEITTNKLCNMLKIINNGDAVQISDKGGYCNVSGFESIWNPILISEIEKNDCIFPIDEVPIAANVLILENGSSVDNDVYLYASNLCGKEKVRIYNTWCNDTPKSIRGLKEIDTEWLASSIASSNKIVFRSKLVDELQLNSFMNLFSSLDSKEIHVSTDVPDKLKSHKLWEINNAKHKIVFF